MLLCAKESCWRFIDSQSAAKVPDRLHAVHAMLEIVDMQGRVLLPLLHCVHSGGRLPYIHQKKITVSTDNQK
jgi:hypothetical protein